MDVQILSPGQYFGLTKIFAGQVAAVEFTSEDLFFWFSVRVKYTYVYTFFESTINL